MMLLPFKSNLRKSKSRIPRQLAMTLGLFLLVMLTSSCTRQCCDWDVVGADEFVCDSYSIRQGKLSILEMEGKDTGYMCPEDMDEYQDIIAEDDILNISVYHPTRKDLVQSIQYLNDHIGGFRVRNGYVQIPDIDPVQVEGLTLDQAKTVIQESFRQQVSEVEVFLSYRDRLSRKVELIGMVSVPAIPVDGKMRLFEVLSKAHVPMGANLFMSYVVRDGRPLAVDLYKLINEGDMSQNIVMRGGDKIFIANPADANVMVMGEVRMPRAVNLPYGFLSLREALVQAGGIPFTGDKNRIMVIRGNLQCPKIYCLSWQHIIHLPNDSLLLMPGDTVYVSETPITQWNRFIEQLLPTCAGFRESYGVYNICN